MRDGVAAAAVAMDTVLYGAKSGELFQLGRTFVSDYCSVPLFLCLWLAAPDVDRRWMEALQHRRRDGTKRRFVLDKRGPAARLTRLCGLPVSWVGWW